MVVLYTGAKNYLNERDVWGRPGPGGRAWRDPKKIGSNFFKSMGWTNNAVLNKLSRDIHPAREHEQIYEITGGGVELVPLLAKHRMVTRCPLSTTDITRMSRICNDFPKTGQEYFRQLCNQVGEREKQKQKAQREDIEESHKHFETWKGFWGRPGHGAPKALSQREKLEFLLYRMPSRRVTSTTATATTTTKSP